MSNGTRFFIGGCSGTSVPTGGSIESTRSGKVQFRPLVRERFGVRTTSLAVMTSLGGYFIDNGSGIDLSAKYLQSEGCTAVYGLQTHWHNDHTCGLTQNSLLFRKGLVLGLKGPYLSPKMNFETLLHQAFDTALWPISPEKVGVTLNPSEFTIGDKIMLNGEVLTAPLNHPGGCVGYRIVTPDGDIVIGTDSELSTVRLQTDFAKFIDGARIAYVDVQYRDEEYRGEIGVGGGPAMSRINWGHSTPQMLGNVLSHCRKAPELILIGHHDPARSDDELLQFEKEVQELMEVPNWSVRFAREGQCYSVGPTVNLVSEKLVAIPA